MKHDATNEVPGSDAGAAGPAARAPHRFDRLTILAVAGEAGADPRTVHRHLNLGHPAKGLVGVRIDRVAVGRGLIAAPLTTAA